MNSSRAETASVAYTDLAVGDHFYVSKERSVVFAKESEHYAIPYPDNTILLGVNPARSVFPRNRDGYAHLPILLRSTGILVKWEDGRP